MIMLVDLSQNSISFTELNEKLVEKGKTLGLSIGLQHEDIFKSMHQI